MAEKRERSAGRVLAAVAGMMLLLPVAYLVLAGPIEWLMANDFISYDNRYVKAFYYPGELLLKYCPPLNDFVRWYLSLWK